MQKCRDCYWCQVSLAGKRKWKCKYNPKRRFNNRDIHGLFCKDFTLDPECLGSDLHKEPVHSNNHYISASLLGRGLGSGIGVALANAMLYLVLKVNIGLEILLLEFLISFCISSGIIIVSGILTKKSIQEHTTEVKDDV